MTQVLGWILQVLILTAGIYLFLRFVRTTRGSLLIRGLLISLVVGVLGLWGLSEALRLEELRHIIQGITGFVVVILAILFQPELRRGISQLGESKLMGRLIRKFGVDTVSEVARAATNMAARRQGALIAFEREAPLSTYIAGGVKIDSNVTRLLLESIFHPGGALHDGAVIIRHDRAAAALCLFPLTENLEVARSTGTRHRAALGVSDETDAVVVVVSEETGAISVCQHGVMRDVAPDRLETVLREMLEPGQRAAAAATSTGAAASATGSAASPSVVRRGPRAALKGVFSKDLMWVALALVLASGILFAAHQDIREPREYPLRLRLGTAAAAVHPADRELLVLPPDDQHRLTAPLADRDHVVEVTGTRAQLDRLGPALAGVLELTGSRTGPLEIDLGQVRWREPVLGLSYAWAGDGPPVVELEPFGERSFPIDGGHVPVDATELDPRYEVHASGVVVPAGEVAIAGPSHLLEDLESGALALELEPVRLRPGDTRDRHERLRLAPALRQLGLGLVGDPVAVVVPIAPARRQVGVVSAEISLVCLEPARADELARWTLPPHSQTARFTIQTAGLLPIGAAPDSQIVRERSSAVRRYVTENLVVFVDVAELPPLGEGRTVPVRWLWRRDWRESLEAPGLDMGTLGGREELSVSLESDAEILLVPRSGPGEHDLPVAPGGAPDGGAPGPGPEENP